MKRLLMRALALCLLPGIAGAASFQGIGVSTATRVSGDGTTVLGYGFIWQSGVLTPSATVEDLSYDGGVMVLGSLRLDNGTPKHLQSIVPGGLGNNHHGGPAAVSADGSTIVGSSGLDGPPYEGRAVRWDASGSVTALGDLPNGVENDSWASGVSADGSVIVGSGRTMEDCLGDWCRRPFRWEGGTMVNIWDNNIVGEVGGQVHVPGFVYANGVSDDGNSVVGSAQIRFGYGYDPDDPSNEVFGTRGFLWDSGDLSLLSVLPGYFSNEAYAVSGDGSVIVGAACTFDYCDGGYGGGLQVAALWTQDGPQSLLDVLVANGANGLEGWTLMGAVDVSSDGRIIVGNGINPLGQREAFIANISPVPIPAAVWLFGSALGVMGWLRRKAIG